MHINIRGKEILFGFNKGRIFKFLHKEKHVLFNEIGNEVEVNKMLNVGNNISN